MTTLLWVYLGLAVLTMGVSAGLLVTDGGRMSVPRLLLIGAMWPVVWIAAVVIFFMEGL